MTGKKFFVKKTKENCNQKVTEKKKRKGKARQIDNVQLHGNKPHLE